MDTTTLTLIAIGLAAGILSGLFGIGGGTLIVPALIFLLGFSAHKATGTSLVVLLPPIGIGAVIEYARHGAVDWRAAVIIAAMVLVGATVGALFANKLDGATLKLLFGAFLMVLSLYTIQGALQSKRNEKQLPPTIQPRTHLQTASLENFPPGATSGVLKRK